MPAYVLASQNPLMHTETSTLISFALIILISFLLNRYAAWCFSFFARTVVSGSLQYGNLLEPVSGIIMFSSDGLPFVSLLGLCHPSRRAALVSDTILQSNKNSCFRSPSCQFYREIENNGASWLGSRHEQYKSARWAYYRLPEEEDTGYKTETSWFEMPLKQHVYL